MNEECLYGTIKSLEDVCTSILQTKRNISQDILIGKLTFAGTTVNKILPSLQAGRGRDLITHYLKLYPNDFTKKYNALLFNRKPATKKASTKGMSPDLKASLALLKGISS